MPTWPTAGGFPQTPQFQNFQEVTPDALVRTRMDTGPEKVRRRFTAAVRPFKMQLGLTTAQVATLDTFYITTLEHGSLAFDWVHPRTSTSCSMRFKNTITYKRLGPDLWTAAFEVDLLPA